MHGFAMLFIQCAAAAVLIGSHAYGKQPLGNPSVACSKRTRLLQGVLCVQQGYTGADPTQIC